MACTHDLTDRGVAVASGGLCPLCLRGEGAVLRRRIADLERCIEEGDARLAALRQMVESYRGTYLVSASGTHLGDPAEKILAAAKGECPYCEGTGATGAGEVCCAKRRGENEEIAALKRQVNDAIRRSERDHMKDADEIAALYRRLAMIERTCAGCQLAVSHEIECPALDAARGE